MRDGLRIAQRDRVLVQHLEQRFDGIELGHQRLHRPANFRDRRQQLALELEVLLEGGGGPLRQIGFRQFLLEHFDFLRHLVGRAARGQPFVPLHGHQPVEIPLKNRVEFAALLTEVGLRDAREALIVRFDERAQVLHRRIALAIGGCEVGNRVRAIGGSLCTGDLQTAPGDQTSQRSGVEHREQNQLRSQEEEQGQRVERDQRDERRAPQHDGLILIDNQFTENRAGRHVLVGRCHRCGYEPGFSVTRLPTLGAAVEVVVGGALMPISVSNC